MATSLAGKRMARERQNLEKPNPDYFVHFPDDNLFSFDAYIYGAPDSLYTHKFIKVHIDIPTSYPITPPIVKFFQRGRGRVHPNLYQDGKVCLSILGTWPGEPWAPGMSIDTVLITIRSLLDKQPFLHEPNQRDDPVYNDWVEYATWRLLLLDYLETESNVTLKAFLDSYLVKNLASINDALGTQTNMYASVKQVANRYDQAATLNVDHASVKREVNMRTRLAMARAENVKLQLEIETPPHDAVRAIDSFTGEQRPGKPATEEAKVAQEVSSCLTKEPLAAQPQTATSNCLSNKKKPELQASSKRKREADVANLDAGRTAKKHSSSTSSSSTLARLFCRGKKRAFVDLT